MFKTRLHLSHTGFALAAIALAGWTGTAQAQSVSPTTGELTFSGQDTIKSTGTSSGVTAIGYINSGAFFSPGTVYPTGLNVFRSGGADQTTAIYTFALQGTGTRTVSSGIVKSIYDGTFTVYQDSPTSITKSTGFDPAGPNTPGNYGTSYATATGFTDGNTFLTGTFHITSSFDTTISPAQGSFGTPANGVVFTGGSLYNDYLLPNNYLTGTLGGTIAPSNGAIAGYSGSVDGQLNASLTINTVPEPSTTAALGLGILGLAGLALTARKRSARTTS